MVYDFRLFIFALLLSLTNYAQGESNNWYFGFGAGVHFNYDGTLNALNDGQLNTFEGCATVSDVDGNLLFYTNGRTVYNRLHNVMVNGLNLFGQPSSSQSVIIVPKPESPNIYYIVTTNSQQAESPNNGLNYAEVDMSLNNGNGEVTLKNVKLLNNCTEKIAAVVKDCTANSLWLLTLGDDGVNTRNFNTFHAFEINSNGIETNSIESTVSTFTYVGGYLKFSLDGTKLAIANMSSGLFLYDFDTDTGIVSNEQEIVINSATDNNAYGVEFSPDGNLLYVHASNDVPYSASHSSSLFQYNLQTTDISASQITIDESRGLFRAALQLGPNGKIYRALTESYDVGTPFLGVINSPNELGLAAVYEHNAVSLNGGLAAQGLPPLVPSFYSEVDILSNEVEITNGLLESCVDEEIILSATYFPGSRYQWEKDGVVLAGESSHVLQRPMAKLSDSGSYKVEVFRPNAESCPIEAESTLVVQALPEVYPQLLSVCDEQIDGVFDGYAEFDLMQIETDASFVYSYYESIQDLNNDLPISAPSDYMNIERNNQFVYYKVLNANGCENVGEIELQVNEPPNISLEATYILCVDSPDLTLVAPSGFDSYSWYKLENTTQELVSSTNQVEIMESGDYVLKIGNQFTNNGNSISCDQEIEFKVVPSNTATIQDVIINDNGDNNTIEIIADGEGDYEYSINGEQYQDSTYFENVISGVVTVFVRDKNGCGIVEQIIEIDPEITTDDFPKFFTPNGDGANDFWQYIPNSNGDINVISIDIYSRMGQLLIQLNPESKGWDGRFNGQMLPETDYWFKANTVNQQTIQGHFSLIR